MDLKFRAQRTNCAKKGQSNFQSPFPTTSSWSKDFEFEIRKFCFEFSSPCCWTQSRDHPFWSSKFTQSDTRFFPTRSSLFCESPRTKELAGSLWARPLSGLFTVDRLRKAGRMVHRAPSRSPEISTLLP